MAISDAYATAAEYRAVTGMTDTTKDAQILIDLTSVSRYLERRLGRFFQKDASAVTRVYLPAVRSDTLLIDDLSAAPTSIKIDEDADGSFADETALAATDYELLPLNAALGPEAQPYTAIRLTPWGTKGQFAPGLRVQVVGAFGWPAVPETIKAATIQLTAIYRLETPRATQRIPELGEAMEASPEARSIINKLLDQYKRGGALFA